MDRFRLCLPVLLLLIFSSDALAQPQHARDHVYGPRGRLIVTIEPDPYAPAAPPSFSAVAASCPSVSVTASWSAATDIGSGVDGYHVYRNSSYLGATESLSYVDNTVQQGTSYNYYVRAVDNNGHSGTASQTASVSVPTCSGFLRWSPADQRWRFGANLFVAWAAEESRVQRILRHIRLNLVASRAAAEKAVGGAE